MAIKVKRKQSRHQAAKEPDQIYTFSEQAFNALERNKKLVLGSLAGVLLLIIAITLIAQKTSSAGREAGAEISSAVLLADAPVGEASDDEETTFETVVARAEAVREAIAGRIGDDPPAAIRLLSAASSVRLGDFEGARADYEAVVEADDASLLALVARQGLAATQASTGDLGAAERSLDAVNAAMPALEHYVTLEKARLAEAAGDLEAALAGYETVASTAGLVITETGVSATNEALVATAEHRAAVIAVLLGRDQAPDEPEEPEETDDGPSEEGETE